MHKIGILHQPRIPASKPMAKEVAAWLQAQNIFCSMGSTWTEIAANNEGSSDISLLIVLGGDGSTLRAAHMTIDYPIPIFGINMGRVGFLSEAQPDEWREKLSRVLQDDFWIERRLIFAHNRLHQVHEFEYYSEISMPVDSIRLLLMDYVYRL